MSAYGTISQPKPDENTRDFYGLPVYYQRDVNSSKFALDIANQAGDLEGLYEIFAEVVEEGQTYPQDSTSLEEFRNYFFGFKTFVVREVSNQDSGDSCSGRVVAGFYIKPNFPGRSAHLANYGLLVHKECRGQGIGNFMVENCIQLARKLSFDALYTNLVYVTNTASIAACKRFGFVQVGCVPNAGNLNGLGYTDAYQFYKSLI